VTKGLKATTRGLADYGYSPVPFFALLFYGIAAAVRFVVRDLRDK
jgi:hypothetical protein